MTIDQIFQLKQSALSTINQHTYLFSSANECIVAAEQVYQWLAKEAFEAETERIAKRDARNAAVGAVVTE
jgi:hypothetical protein